MERDDVKLGDEFECGGKIYRCTDIGTRTVIGILISSGTMGWTEKGIAVTRELGRREAEELHWFDGPPYGVVEMVFDEDDLQICQRVGRSR